MIPKSTGLTKNGHQQIHKKLAAILKGYFQYLPLFHESDFLENLRVLL
jgi:hypothetical protein